MDEITSWEDIENDGNLFNIFSSNYVLEIFF